MDTTKYESRIFRITRFVVPKSSEKEFLTNVAETNTSFDDAEGCLQRLVLKEQGTSALTNFITIGEWASEAAIQSALQAAAVRQARIKLSPQEMFQRLRIEAELRTYVPAFDPPA